MQGWGLFFFLLFLALVVGGGGWIFWTRYRARRAGLPPPPWSSYIPFYNGSNRSSPSYPSPRPSRISDFVKDTIAKLRNKRSARGAYEEPFDRAGRPGGNSGMPRAGAASAGRGLDPDEAWDTRVGNEADAYGPPGGYYGEEDDSDDGHGIGMHSYGRGSHAALPAYGQGQTQHPQGSSAYVGGTQAGLDRRYDEEMGYGGAQGGRTPTAQNPNPFDDQAERSELRAVSPRPAMHGREPSRDTMASTSTTQSRQSAFREGL